MRLKLEMSRAHIPFRTLKKVYKLNDSSDVHRFTSIRQINHGLLPTNFLSVFGHFVWLVLKWLKHLVRIHTLVALP